MMRLGCTRSLKIVSKMWKVQEKLSTCRKMKIVFFFLQINKSHLVCVHGRACTLLPLKARWSTSESCSLRPVWPSAQCRSVSSGLPGGCCWCTFWPHCWECPGSKGNLSRDTQTITRYLRALAKIYDSKYANGVVHKKRKTVSKLLFFFKKEVKIKDKAHGQLFLHWMSSRFLSLFIPKSSLDLKVQRKTKGFSLADHHSTVQSTQMHPLTRRVKKQKQKNLPRESLDLICNLICNFCCVTKKKNFFVVFSSG